MRVKAKPLGWDMTDDEGSPTLEGLPEYVEGELTTKHVHSAFGNIDYTKHMVGDVDVDPDTISQLDKAWFYVSVKNDAWENEARDNAGKWTTDSGTDIEPTGYGGYYSGSDLLPFIGKTVTAQFGTTTIHGTLGIHGDRVTFDNYKTTTNTGGHHPLTSSGERTDGAIDKLDSLKVHGMADEKESTYTKVPATGPMDPDEPNPFLGSNTYTKDDLTPVIGKQVTMVTSDGDTLTGKLSGVENGNAYFDGSVDVKMADGTKDTYSDFWHPLSTVTDVVTTEPFVDKDVQELADLLKPVGVGSQPTGITQPFGGGLPILVGNGSYYTPDDLKPYVGKDVWVAPDPSWTHSDKETDIVHINSVTPYGSVQVTYANGQQAQINPEAWQAIAVLPGQDTATAEPTPDTTTPKVAEPILPTGTKGQYTAGGLKPYLGQSITVTMANGDQITGILKTAKGDPHYTGAVLTVDNGTQMQEFAPAGPGKYVGISLPGTATSEPASEPTSEQLVGTAGGGLFTKDDLTPHEGKMVTIIDGDGNELIGTLHVGVSGVYLNNATAHYADGSTSAFDNGLFRNFDEVTKVTLGEPETAPKEPAQPEPPTYTGQTVIKGSLYGGVYASDDLKPYIGQLVKYDVPGGNTYVGTLAQGDNGYLKLTDVTGKWKNDTWAEADTALINPEPGSLSVGSYTPVTGKPTGAGGTWTDEDLNPFIGKQISLTTAVGHVVSGQLLGTSLNKDGGQKLDFGPDTTVLFKDEETPQPMQGPDPAVHSVYAGTGSQITLADSQPTAEPVTVPKETAQQVKPTGTDPTHSNGFLGEKGAYSSTDLKGYKGKQLMVTWAYSDYSAATQSKGGTLVAIGPKFATIKYSPAYTGVKIPVGSITEVHAGYTPQDIAPHIGKIVTIETGKGNSFTGTLDTSPINPNTVVLHAAQGAYASGAVKPMYAAKLSYSAIKNLHIGVPAEVQAKLDGKPAPVVKDPYLAHLGGTNYQPSGTTTAAGEQVYTPTGHAPANPTGPQGQNTGKPEPYVHWGNPIKSSGTGGYYSAEDMQQYLAKNSTLTVAIKGSGSNVSGKITAIGTDGNGNPTFTIGNNVVSTTNIAQIDKGASSSFVAPPVSSQYDASQPAKAPEWQSDGVKRDSFAVAKKGGFGNADETKARLDGKGLSPTEAFNAAHGESIPYDGKDVEDLELRLTKVEDKGKPTVEVKFKLTADAKQRLMNAVTAQDSNWGVSKMTVERKEFNGHGMTVAGSPRVFSGNTAHGTVAGAAIQFHYGGDARAYDGMVQARIPEDQFGQGKLDELMKGLGVRGIGPAQPEDVKAMGDAKVNQLFKGDLGTTIKDQNSIDGSRVYISRSGSGRVESLLPKEDAEKIAKATNVKSFVHSWYTTPDDLVNAIASGQPLVATAHRWSEGINNSGMSSSSDVGTGGADYVFTRQEHKAPESITSGGGSKPYLVFDGPKMLQRTDYFAHYKDKYGVAHGSDYKSVPTMNNLKTHQSNAETMFKARVSNDALVKVLVPSSDRQSMINGLKAKGITQVNGKSVEDLIQSSGY